MSVEKAELSRKWEASTSPSFRNGAHDEEKPQAAAVAAV
jgi:hypothetical protein